MACSLFSPQIPPAINHGAIINGTQGRNIILRGRQEIRPDLSFNPRQLELETVNVAHRVVVLLSNLDGLVVDVVHLSGRGQVEDFLDEEAHLGVVHLAVGHQELVVQQLGVAQSLIHIFVQAFLDKVAELVGKFTSR